MGWLFWMSFFSSTFLAWLWNFWANFFSNFVCILCGYLFLPCGMFWRSCIKIIHLCNDGGRTNKVEEEGVLPTMVLVFTKNFFLLILDMNGILVAIYHKHEALPLEAHHMKFDNFYSNILLFLFFSIMVFFFSFSVQGFVHLVCL